MKVKKQILVLFLTMLVEIPILSAPKQKKEQKNKRRKLSERLLHQKSTR